MALSKEDLKDRMKDHNVVVLDVLPSAEFEKLHITGSQSLPMGADTDTFVASVEKIHGKNKSFVTYCASSTCDLGPNAAKALKVKGFKADDYPGGMKEWSEAGYPTEGTDVKVPSLGQSVETASSN
jgi:rhodanese-related sulfurtransferase